MSDKMPDDDIFAFLLGSGTWHGISWGEKPNLEPKFWWRRPLRDALEKAVKERDALKAENERLRDALKRLTAEAKLDGLHEKAGWDCWIMEAEKALQGGDEIAHERGEG